MKKSLFPVLALMLTIALAVPLFAADRPSAPESQAPPHQETTPLELSDLGESPSNSTYETCEQMFETFPCVEIYVCLVCNGAGGQTGNCRELVEIVPLPDCP